ncbi:MAG: hypothetical protein M3N04_04470, partial [Actinomycetota bacterium]|nr:hypothetical protein [Actinomycetota bacterium]
PASPTGGAPPRLARAASSDAGAGMIAGRVDPAVAGRSWVSVQRWNGRRWIARFDLPVGAGGRYAGRLRTDGLYRVVYRGAAGPSVLVR